jgi:hypothetical protein
MHIICLHHGAGSIPWEVLRDLVQDHALRKISLGNNKFDSVGEIPPLVSEMNKLEELNLHTLGFTGRVILYFVHYDVHTSILHELPQNRKSKNPKIKILMCTHQSCMNCPKIENQKILKIEILMPTHQSCMNCPKIENQQIQKSKS